MDDYDRFDHWEPQGFGLATKPTRFCPRCGSAVLSARRADHYRRCGPWWIRLLIWIRGAHR